ncbi:MAG: hypothetical protein HYV08_09785 [Deltaproteobacteria bacterium]|nr:hypothetical protein [Deltaproteobacteria bacterium]
MKASSRGEVPEPRGGEGLGVRPLLLGLAMAGGVAFVVAATGAQWQRAWQIFLVNLLFWMGMAQGGVVLAALYELTGSRWGEPVRRLALGLGGFLPLAFLLFLLLPLGREALFPEVHGAVAEQAWLAFPFRFGRDAGGLLVLFGVSLAYMSARLRAPSRPEGASPRHRGLAASLLLLYVTVFTLLAADLVMALDPHWISTLFGAYFFLTSFLIGLGGTAITAALAAGSWRFHGLVTRSQLHDLGKLLFAFTVGSAYFFFSQFLVIWYGNLPEEIGFVILRLRARPWAPLAWIIALGGFALPAGALLARAPKRTPLALSGIAVAILTGMWLERFLLVVPSLWKSPDLPIGWLEFLVTAGYGAVFVLCARALVPRALGSLLPGAFLRDGTAPGGPR